MKVIFGKRFVGALAGGLLLSVIPGFFAVSGGGRSDAGELPLLVDQGKGRLSVNRASLLEQIRNDLSLGPRDAVSVGSVPASIHGPEGDNVTAMLTREGPEGKGRYLYTLNVMEKNVARESFFLHVRVLRKSRESAFRPGSTAPGSPSYVQAESADGGERLVHSGDSVRVTARGKGFLIRFTGISQSEGFLGERVSVVNPMSGAGMAGRVTGRDRVEVDLTGNGS